MLVCEVARTGIASRHPILAIVVVAGLATAYHRRVRRDGRVAGVAARIPNSFRQTDTLEAA